MSHEAFVICVELKYEPRNQTSLSLYPKQNKIVSVATDLGELFGSSGELEGTRPPGSQDPGIVLLPSQTPAQIITKDYLAI